MHSKIYFPNLLKTALTKIPEKESKSNMGYAGDAAAGGALGLGGYSLYERNRGEKLTYKVKASIDGVMKDVSKSKMIDAVKEISKLPKDLKDRVLYINPEDENMLRKAQKFFKSGTATEADSIIRDSIAASQGLGHLDVAIIPIKGKYALIGPRQMPKDIFYHEIGHAVRYDTPLLGKVRKLLYKVPLDITHGREESKAWDYAKKHSKVTKSMRQLGERSHEAETAMGKYKVLLPIAALLALGARAAYKKSDDKE